MHLKLEIAQCVVHWRHQMENGYLMWTSHGRELSREKKDGPWHKWCCYCCGPKCGDRGVEEDSE